MFKFAKEFAESNKPLNILVNNAGCMINERKLVENNIEANFATNTLGTYILTKTLIPTIAKSEKPRIVIKKKENFKNLINYFYLVYRDFGWNVGSKIRLRRFKS